METLKSGIENKGKDKYLGKQKLILNTEFLYERSNILRSWDSASSFYRQDTKSLIDIVSLKHVKMGNITGSMSDKCIDFW